MARRFPFRVGRAPGSELRLEEAGVWDRHLRLEIRRQAGLILVAQAGAPTAVNGKPVPEDILLHNDDTIEVGAVRIRFLLGETTQRSPRLREWLTWIGIALVSFGQVGLVYWLSR